MLKACKQVSATIILGTAIVGLSGCAAMNTAITHRHLDVQTKMSKTIFLNPVNDDQKTVYIDIHNTSDQDVSTVSPLLKSQLQSKGYKIVSSLNKAHYLLQANVLQIGKSSQSAAQNALLGGYGGALAGAALGSGIGALATDSGAGILTGGIIGGVAGTIADDLVSDTTYTMITDVQISMRLPKGSKAQSTTVADMQQGASTSQVTQLSQRTDWMRYCTRIVSTADKVNLDFEKAKPVLEQQLAHSIAGVF